MDVGELFPGRFVKASDLGGHDVTLAIATITTEELVGETGPKVKGIVGFANAKKALVLNRTNAECIAAMHGRDTEAWVGKRITLYAGVHMGEPCIRVRGSPDIAADVAFELRLPRKKPQPMVMRRTGSKAKADAGSER